MNKGETDFREKTIEICPCGHQMQGYVIIDGMLKINRILDVMEFPMTFFSVADGVLKFHDKELQAIQITDINTGTMYDVNFAVFMLKATFSEGRAWLPMHEWAIGKGDTKQASLFSDGDLPIGTSVKNRFYGEGKVTGKPITAWDEKKCYPVDFMDSKTSGKFYEADLEIVSGEPHG